MSAGLVSTFQKITAELERIRTKVDPSVLVKAQPVAADFRMPVCRAPGCRIPYKAGAPCAPHLAEMATVWIYAGGNPWPDGLELGVLWHCEAGLPSAQRVAHTFPDQLMVGVDYPVRRATP